MDGDYLWDDLTSDSSVFVRLSHLHLWKPTYHTTINESYEGDITGQMARIAGAGAQPM